MKYQLIVLFGPPGCGKGTQSQILNKQHNYVQLGMSALLEEYISQSKDLKIEQIRIDRIKNNFKQGELVAFEDVVSIMEMNFSKNLKKGKMITLDGFPRTENQSIWLSGLITKDKVKTLFIHFDLQLEEVIRRIDHRWFVEGSNAIYSSQEEALANAPKSQNPYRRDLDLNQDIIIKRYNEQYWNGKHDIIAGIENNQFVDIIHIDASLSVAQITKHIDKKL
jgi:adenylate kinase